MGIESLIGAGIGLLGASEQSDAAGQSAAAQAEAARIAAEAAAFRPVGLTNRFGKSGFTYDDKGNITGAGYQVAPDLAAMREGMLGLAGGSLAQAQQARQMQPNIDASANSLYNLGSSFLPSSSGYSVSPESQQYSQFLRNQASMSTPTDYSGRATGEAQGLYNQLSGMANKVMPTNYDTTAAAQKYMQQQQGLLAPEREQQLAKVRNDLQQSGRAGLSFGATSAGGMAATNPEMAAYYNSIAQQDRQLAAGAQQQARSDLQSDIGLGTQLGTTALGQLSQSQQQQLQNALSKGQYAAGLSGTALTAQQQADQLARSNMLQNISTGTGLLGSSINLLGQGYGLQSAALQPWQQYMQGAQSVEGMGQTALDQATALGAKMSTAGANQAQYLNRSVNGGTGYSALGAGLMGLGQNQQFMSGLSGLFGNTGTNYTNQQGFMNTPSYLVR